MDSGAGLSGRVGTLSAMIWQADRFVCGVAVCVCVFVQFLGGECRTTCRASPIAQLVERAAVNLKVAGSNPAGRASFTHITLAQSLERTTKYDQ